MTLSVRTHPPSSLLLFLQSAPPQETLRAFKNDCEVYGMPWYSSTAQQLCVALLIRNPLLQRYPPRKTNICAFLKLLLTQLQSTETMTLITDTSDDDAIDSRLMEAYVEYSIDSNDDSRVAKCYKTFYCPSSHEMYLPVRLASEQFTNVGLALWPAAFVLAQFLQEEFTARTSTVLPSQGEIRLLELGAGVGLMPLVLHRCQPCQERLQRCILTDYQPELIENIMFNLTSNGIAAGMSGIQGSDELVHITDILDWTESEVNHRKLREWGCNLIVAADCIYEVELIVPLVLTLRDALNSTEGAVAVVVQTHRQSATMRHFFDAVHAASLRVESFSLSSTALEDNSKTGGRRLALRSATIDAEGHLTTNNNNNNNSNNNSCSDNCCGNGESDGCWSGWLGPFYVTSEAAVGIHVLRR